MCSFCVSTWIYLMYSRSVKIVEQVCKVNVYYFLKSISCKRLKLIISLFRVHRLKVFSFCVCGLWIFSRRWVLRTCCTRARDVGSSWTCSAWWGLRIWRTQAQTPPATWGLLWSLPSCTPSWSAPTRGR